MGTFLALSGVACGPTQTRGDVAAALRDFAEAKGGSMTPGPVDDERKQLVIAGGDGGAPVTVLYPDGFIGWDDASRHLSTALDAPTLSLHIHDGDLWMYLLFSEGQVVDQFNPIPDYWGELSPEECDSWRGNAAVLAEHWPATDAASIEKYLVSWDLDSEALSKAYENDEHAIGVDWQLLDFMRKLNLIYPMGDSGELLGDPYVFNVRTRLGRR